MIIIQKVHNLEASDVYGKGAQPSAQILGWWDILYHLSLGLLYSVGGNFRNAVWKNKRLVFLIAGIGVPFTAIYISQNSAASCLLKV
jgi:hypothetical protein